MLPRSRRSEYLLSAISLSSDALHPLSLSPPLQQRSSMASVTFQPQSLTDLYNELCCIYSDSATQLGAPSTSGSGTNLQASSVKKLKKLLGAGTPDILQAKNLTQRYAELLPTAALKGNAQVKLVASHSHKITGNALSSSSSSASSSTSLLPPSTFITWQPSFLAVVRRTLHIFLLSRPPGMFIPSEIALSLFAFSLEVHPSHTTQQASAASTVGTAQGNDGNLCVAQPTQCIPQSGNTPNTPGVAIKSKSTSRPYLVLKPSVVSGGVHEALALDWDPMAWEYWILIDSDHELSQWIECLQQVCPNPQNFSIIL